MATLTVGINAGQGQQCQEASIQFDHWNNWIILYFGVTRNFDYYQVGMRDFGPSFRSFALQTHQTRLDSVGTLEIAYRKRRKQLDWQTLLSLCPSIDHTSLLLCCWCVSAGETQCGAHSKCKLLALKISAKCSWFEPNKLRHISREIYRDREKERAYV